MTDTLRLSRARAKIFEGIAPISEWPTVLIDSLTEKYKEAFHNRCEAVRLYHANTPVEQIESVTGVHATAVGRLARRCCEMAPDGRPWGFRSLVPHQRIKDYTRKKPVLKKLPEAQGGQAGALQQILDRFPDLERELVALIRKEAKHSKVYEHKIRRKTLHNIFLELLREKGVSAQEWPFTTKHRGINSVGGLMRAIIANNFERSVSSRESREARAHLATGAGISSLLRISEPYDAIEVDAHHIDAHVSIRFKTGMDTYRPVLIERLWLLVAIDRASTAVLAHTVVYRSEVAAEDVIRLLTNAAEGKWEPRQLTIPGIAYAPGAGAPSASIAQSAFALWSTLMLDGALANLSDAVTKRARRNLGFSINFGPVAHFERRPNVERLFQKVSQDVFRRFVSTTGSHPKNGRADDAEQAAIKHEVDADEVEELLHVFMANHNVTPTEGLCNLTPKEFLEQKTQDGHFIFRKLPKANWDGNSILPCIEIRTVRGSVKDGRRPYVKIDGVNYTSPTLASSYRLLGQELQIKINEEDMRQVEAYLMDGAYLGFLRADPKWSVTKHSRSTRKALNSVRNEVLPFMEAAQDIVVAYHRYLSTKKSKKGQNPGAPSPKDATKAARVAKDAGLELEIPPMDEKNKTIAADLLLPKAEAQPIVIFPSSMPDLNAILNKNRR